MTRWCMFNVTESLELTYVQVFKLPTTSEEWVLYGEEQAWNPVQGT